MSDRLDGFLSQNGFGTRSAVRQLIHWGGVKVNGKTILVRWAPGDEVRPDKAKVSLAKDAKEWGLFHPKAVEHGSRERRGRARVDHPRGNRSVRRSIQPNRDAG